MKLCTSCGKELASEAAFCGGCGVSLSMDNERFELNEPETVCESEIADETTDTLEHKYAPPPPSGQSKTRTKISPLIIALSSALVICIVVIAFMLANSGDNTPPSPTIDFHTEGTFTEYVEENIADDLDAIETIDPFVETPAEAPVSPEVEIVDDEVALGDLVGRWIAYSLIANDWEDSGIRWEFLRDGTWVRINENNFGSRVYGTWLIEGIDDLTLRAESFGWENNTRFHAVRWGDSNRVYVTVRGSINPDTILMR